MSDIKAIALDILTRSVDRLSSDEEIEEIYKCIDMLNETIEDQPENYRLMAECYAKVQNYKKAKEVFAKIYNTKNKKDLKKYSEYLRYQQIRPIIRPSKRAKLLPDIKYVSKEMAESMLIRNEGTPCEICNSTTAPLYVGLAFNDDGSKVCCANLEKKFCINCLLNGTAAKLHNISFNNKLVRYFSGIENDKISFVCSSISEMFISIPKTAKKKESVNLKLFKNDFVEGVKFIKNQKLIFAVISLSLILNFAFAPMSSIGLAFVSKQLFKVSDYQYGIQESVLCVAMMIAPLFISRIHEKFKSGRIMYYSVLIVCGIVTAVAVVTSRFYTGLFSSNLGPFISFTVLIFIVSFIVGIINVEFSIVEQTAVPLERMGRVNTVCSALSMGAMPLGQMIFGVLFDSIPAWTCYVITAVIFFVSIVLFRNKLIDDNMTENNSIAEITE